MSEPPCLMSEVPCFINEVACGANEAAAALPTRLRATHREGPQEAASSVRKSVLFLPLERGDKKEVGARGMLLKTSLGWGKKGKARGNDVAHVTTRCQDS